MQKSPSTNLSLEDSLVIGIMLFIVTGKSIRLLFGKKLKFFLKIFHVRTNLYARV